MATAARSQRGLDAGRSVYPAGCTAGMLPKMRAQIYEVDMKTGHKSTKGAAMTQRPRHRSTINWLLSTTPEGLLRALRGWLGRLCRHHDGTSFMYALFSKFLKLSQMKTGRQPLEGHPARSSSVLSNNYRIRLCKIQAVCCRHSPQKKNVSAMLARRPVGMGEKHSGGKVPSDLPLTWPQIEVGTKASRG